MMRWNTPAQNPRELTRYMALGCRAPASSRGRRPSGRRPPGRPRPAGPPAPRGGRRPAPAPRRSEAAGAPGAVRLELALRLRDGVLRAADALGRQQALVVGDGHLSTVCNEVISQLREAILVAVM